ncbi:AimR family lysis-lysogeny pheromone receptor [Bacillus cytotoxicus]|uniref:AimR family lysis-lysogeny pheromone receptor n=1 Tax=Bacillus cytotoxicus TaxID=580165 RepID=UPI003D7EEF34
MLRFHREICDTINDRDDITFSSVAEKIGVSKQCMSKFKKDGAIGFRKLLRISYYLFPDEQREKMEKWCLQLDSAESIQQSLEYAAITRNVKLLRQLIQIHKKSDGVIRDYINVYSIIYNYMQGKIKGIDLIENLNKIGRVEDSTLNILVNIIKCYNYFAQKKIHIMLEVAQDVSSMMGDLSDSRKLFIKECFLHRLAEILAPIFLHRNQLHLARKYASLIINANICAKTVADASYYVGMTYLNEDNERCLQYLHDSYVIAKTIGVERFEVQARDRLDCVKIYLGIPLGAESDTRLIEYQKDNTKGQLIDSIIKERGEKDFLLLYKARSYNSFSELYECFQHFFSDSNFFFSSLVAREIYERGDRSGLTESLINFKVDIENEKGGIQFEEDFIRSFCGFSSGSRVVCA